MHLRSCKCALLMQGTHISSLRDEKGRMFFLHYLYILYSLQDQDSRIFRVELLRSSRSEWHSPTPNCASLTRGYPYLSPIRGREISTINVNQELRGTKQKVQRYQHFFICIVYGLRFYLPVFMIKEFSSGK